MQKLNPESLIPLLKKLESYIQFKDERNNTISNSDVAWQIDHSLKVINLVTEALASSNPDQYKWCFNKWRLLLFTLNYIPRGKAKAPKIVRPPEVILTDDLNKQVSLAYKNVENLKPLNENAYFTHFVFGQLNKTKTIQFLQLHTNHHLKIIRDILK
ncbi:DUF1569 domain-containing protein [Hanstruepera ponticola]|uniref:DUF1569 domain-containing protein n=1 Tax=Hanstruepera ponticola TaxID=2042995 RepID=UPI000CF17A7A|nr:DUF1569 domain-containing protein [Hanstruepera ponticola]